MHSTKPAELLPKVLVIAALLAMLPAAALAHSDYGTAGFGGAPVAGKAPVSPTALGLSATSATRGPETAGPTDGREANTSAPKGPCTDQIAGFFPEGQGHDHLDITQHRFSCGTGLSSFLPLNGQGQLSNEATGEFDVKGDIAAVAVAYPQSGAVFFDVSDPAKPRFLSRYRDSECEGLAVDVDCGAYIDLSGDGKVAFLSNQNVTGAPGRVPDAQAPAPSVPGVITIDLRDPTRPVRADVDAVGEDSGGNHTSRWHGVPEEFARQSGGPAGEFVYAINNGGAVDIFELRRTGGTPSLTPITSIPMEEQHDTFIQNDPIDKKTYMYVAAGFSTGFTVYDVTNPRTPRLVAEWDLTPECTEDWYSHTIDVKVTADRRYVTMPAELFAIPNANPNPSGSVRQQPEADKQRGCGTIDGNGDRAGPMWIVDATDLTKLGPAFDSATKGERDQPSTSSGGAEADSARVTPEEVALKGASQRALVATYVNPADRAAGNLTFSIHNQQIVGDSIYTSNYHGGVAKLDASGAFAGRNERPSEVGQVIPSGEPTRPIYTAPALLIPFFKTFTNSRPLVWDLVHYKGYTLVADMVGGFYSYCFAGDPCTPQPEAAAAGQPPTTQQPAASVQPAGRGGRRFLISRRAFALTRGGVARVLVSCRQASRCRGTIRLRTAARVRSGGRLRRLSIGRRSFSVPARRRTVLRVRISSAGRRLIRRPGGTRVLAVANVGPEVGAAGSRRSTTTASFRVVRARAARSR